MLTGRPHSPQNVENANPGAPNDSPSLGALVGRVQPPVGALPTSVTLPHRIFNTDGSVWPGQDAGFLGRAGDPWLLNAKDTPEGYRVREIDLPTDLDPSRVGRRMALIDGFRKGLDALDRDPARHRRSAPHPDGGHRGGRQRVGRRHPQRAVGLSPRGKIAGELHVGDPVAPSTARSATAAPRARTSSIATLRTRTARPW